MIIRVLRVDRLVVDFSQGTGGCAHTGGATVTGEVSFTEEFNEVMGAVTLNRAAVADPAWVLFRRDGGTCETGVEGLTERA